VLPTEGGLNYRELGDKLNLTDDGARRRAQQMVELGYASNLQQRKHAAAKIVQGAEPPVADEHGFLPTVEEVEETFAAMIAEAEEDTSPTTSPENGVGVVGIAQKRLNHAGLNPDLPESGSKRLNHAGLRPIPTPPTDFPGEGDREGCETAPPEAPSHRGPPRSSRDSSGSQFAEGASTSGPPRTNRDLSGELDERRNGSGDPIGDRRAAELLAEDES
jgi:hypothetical protein